MPAGLEEEMEVKDEEEIVFEQGIEINVSLPHKKVKELHALGGERSLTSIALLFAMSQVNPPPFLVLDEQMRRWMKQILASTGICWRNFQTFPAYRRDPQSRLCQAECFMVLPWAVTVPQTSP